MEKTSNNLEGQWPDKPFLTEEDLMQLFGVSKSSIRRWRKGYVIPFIQLNGMYYSPLVLLKMVLKEKIDESYTQFKTFRDQKRSKNKKTNGKE